MLSEPETFTTTGDGDVFYYQRIVMHFRPEITVGVLKQCLSQLCMLDMILSSSHAPDSILVSAMTVFFNLK